ncbi:Tetratricopeptide repeat protein [compost metagenome]
MNREPLYLFSQSPIWELQRRYYEEQGMLAWQDEEVPHYITSNPVIARAYAEILFAFLRDRIAVKSPAEKPETVYMLELGAGSGRMSFHLLKHLCALRDESGIEIPSFCYIMSDLPMKNIQFWSEHPSLRPFVEQGCLDFARFDAEHDETIHLLQSGIHIQKGDLAQPLVLVANYFLDSLPQELLYVHDQQMYECWMSLQQGDGITTDTSTIIGGLKPEYQYRLAEENPNSAFQEVIEVYRTQLDESHFLFPHIGIRCLERLRGLSQQGFMLLTADKGDHRLNYWNGRGVPELIHHGSFSLTANYHAFKYYYEQQGAQSLFTQHHYNHLNIGCILMVPSSDIYPEMRLAYRRFVEDFGPDDFFSLKKWVDEHLMMTEWSHLFAYLRLSGHDSRLFKQCFKRIMELLPEIGDEDQEDLRRIIFTVWDWHYPMEQKNDLAFNCGLLLYQMDEYEDALWFFEHSMNDHEEHISVFYNMAICYYQLNRDREAIHAADQALSLDPHHEGARTLMDKILREQPTNA